MPTFEPAKLHQKLGPRGNSESMEKLKIGFTCGDLSGIGLEVIIKTFMDNRMVELCTPVVYAAKRTTAEYRRQLGIKDFSFEEVPDATRANPKRACVVNVWNDDVPITLGQPTPESGKCALLSLQAATRDLKEGRIDAMVTAPIDKKNIQGEAFKFPGHTEYLAAQFGTDDYAMLMLSDHLRVAFMTGHVPLSQVAKDLSFERIMKKLRFLDRIFPSDFGIVKPRIAVLGLNPHNGDQGIIGNEERDVIIPAIRKAKDDGLMVFGPFSADGFFGSGAFRQFDVVLAMYHDQGLIPFKTMNFDHGVNFTAGLPKVRTSPDHGTAYDIAGQGVASESSLRDAVYAAIDIVRAREGFAEWSANPLKQFDLRKLKKPVPGQKPQQGKQSGKPKLSAQDSVADVNDLDDAVDDIDE